MILQSKSSFFRFVPRDVVAADLPNVFEGCALVNSYDAANYRFGVKRSGGSANDWFSGIAMSPRKTFNSNIKVEKLTIASTAAIVLQRTALAVAVSGVADGAQIAVSTSAAAADNIQSGTDTATGHTTLAFHSSHVGLTFFVVYSYTITAAEAAGLFGENYGSRFPVDATGKVSAIQNGIVFTNAFDPTANWAASPKVKIVAGGLFTDGASSATGATPSNVEVAYLPTADVPYVGLVIK